MVSVISQVLFSLVRKHYFQLAKLREDEIEKTKIQETVVQEKKKEKTQKVYSKGVGKFINPALKKEARYSLLRF